MGAMGEYGSEFGAARSPAFALVMKDAKQSTKPRNAWRAAVTLSICDMEISLVKTTGLLRCRLALIVHHFGVTPLSHVETAEYAENLILIAWMMGSPKLCGLAAAELCTRPLANARRRLPGLCGRAGSHVRRIGDLLHPERESQAVLDDLKRSMGSFDFGAQYQQEPVADGGNLIKWKWFKFYDNPPVRQPGDKIIVSCDTAMSSKDLASYSACVVLQVREETVFVLDVLRERLEFPDLRRAIVDIHHRWRRATNNYALLIEDKGSGMSLIQDLKRDGIRAIAVDPQGDKAMRMNAQTARIEAGAVYLPRSAAWLDEFRREILAFPAGRHNDQVDALSQGLNRAFDRSRKMIMRTVGGCVSRYVSERLELASPKSQFQPFGAASIGGIHHNAIGAASYALARSGLLFDFRLAVQVERHACRDLLDRSRRCSVHPTGNPACLRPHERFVGADQ